MTAPKQKQPPPQQRDEDCVKSSVVPPKLQENLSPAALCAVTLRRVRFVRRKLRGGLKNLLPERLAAKADVLSAQQGMFF